jgi:hypothetical protein
MNKKKQVCKVLEANRLAPLDARGAVAGLRFPAPDLICPNITNTTVSSSPSCCREEGRRGEGSGAVGGEEGSTYFVRVASRGGPTNMAR